MLTYAGGAAPAGVGAHGARLYSPPDAAPPWPATGPRLVYNHSNSDVDYDELRTLLWRGSYERRGRDRPHPRAGDHHQPGQRPPSPRRGAGHDPAGPFLAQRPGLGLWGIGRRGAGAHGRADAVRDAGDAGALRQPLG